MLAKMIERETVDAFDLSNSVTIEVHPASAKSICRFLSSIARDGKCDGLGPGQVNDLAWLCRCVGIGAIGSPRRLKLIALIAASAFVARPSPHRPDRLRMHPKRAQQLGEIVLGELERWPIVVDMARAASPR
jgi:hypothetical protein